MYGFLFCFTKQSLFISATKSRNSVNSLVCFTVLCTNLFFTLLYWVINYRHQSHFLSNCSFFKHFYVIISMPFRCVCDKIEVYGISPISIKHISVFCYSLHRITCEQTLNLSYSQGTWYENWAFVLPNAMHSKDLNWIKLISISLSSLKLTHCYVSLVSQ